MEIKGRGFVITGGSGFVGSFVAEELLQRGARRVVLFDKAVRKDNLDRLTSHDRVEVMEGDLLDWDALTRAMTAADGVFHLAVLPLGACEQDYERAFEVNIRGSFQVARAADAAGVKKIVYASASSVYGDTNEVMDEQHAFNPWSMYGVSKLCAEFLLRPFHRRLAYAIVRYMNVYGPRQAGGLIPATLRRIKAGEPPVISGDGSASFDFVHVRDAARCTVLAMASDVSGEAFNVGGGTEVSVKDIVGLLLELTGSPLTPVYQEAPPGAMTRRVGSSEKAERLLGYRCAVPLRDGLKELVTEWHAGCAA